MGKKGEKEENPFPFRLRGGKKREGGRKAASIAFDRGKEGALKERAKKKGGGSPLPDKGGKEGGKKYESPYLLPQKFPSASVGERKEGGVHFFPGWEKERGEKGDRIFASAAEKGGVKRGRKTEKSFANEKRGEIPAPFAGAQKVGVVRDGREKSEEGGKEKGEECFFSFLHFYERKKEEG